MSNGIVPTEPVTDYNDCPPRSYDEIEDDSDIPRTPYQRWREGLWTVIYHDDGSMGIRDCPQPGTGPH